MTSRLAPLRGHPLTREQWFALSRNTRIQWLEKTQFDRKPPSKELMNTVMKDLLRGRTDVGSKSGNK